MNSFKADMYKFYWEKRGLVPTLVIGLLVAMFSLFFKSSNENIPAFQSMISNMSGFIPLVFISATLFFWGEDYSSRSINLLLIKESKRWKVFMYKLLATFSLSLFFILFFYGLTAMAIAETDLSLIVLTFLHQLPYYLVILSLSILIFQVFEKVYESCMVYLLYVLLLDNLLVYILPTSNSYLEQYLFMTLNLKMSASFTDWSLVNSLYPLSLSLVIAGIALCIFNKLEFK